jgi:hypothetical protein
VNVIIGRPKTEVVVDGIATIEPQLGPRSNITRSKIVVVFTVPMIQC